MKVIALVDNPSPDTINTATRSNLKGVTRWSTPVTVYSAGLGAAVVVQHDLGAVPNDLDVSSYVDGRVWADQDDRAVWTSTAVTFHVSHGGQYVVKAGFR